jgi:hypothetical protein
VMINAYHQDLVFVVQEGDPKEWLRIVDTSAASPFDFCELGTAQCLRDSEYRVKARSIVILVKRNC